MLLSFDKKLRRKAELQADFLEHFHRKIYVSKTGSCSSFVNGNVARLAFANPALFSQITHVPLSIIKGG